MPPAGRLRAVECWLGIDVGGTKLAAGLVGRRGELLSFVRRPTPRDLSGDQLCDALVTLAQEALEEGGGAEPSACGLGCGGPISPGGAHVSPLHIPAWRDFPLRDRVADALGMPVTIDNDARAFALGEGWVGAAAGVDQFIAMVVSTGVGGGIVVGGRLLPGATGNAGHLGHVVVEPHGRVCACGGRGCLEAEVSGTAIAEMTGRPAEQAGDAERARSGTLVGRALASAAAVLDVQLAVIGGSVALGSGDTFFDAARREYKQRAGLEFIRDLQIRPAALGGSGGVIGAAALAISR